MQTSYRRYSSCILSGSILSFLALCPTVQAVDNLWTGAVNNDWNNPGNWSLGRVPTNANGQTTGDTFDDAVVDTLTNFPVITTDLAATPRDLVTGDGAGNVGRVDQLSGVASTGNGNWFFVGRNNGTGTYNLADTTHSGGTLTHFGTGSGSINVGGRVYVGGANGGAPATGTFNVNTSGTLAVGNDLAVGSAGGTGVMNVDAGTITTGGWNFIGKDEATPGTAGANGTLTMSGGTITNTGGRTYVGQQNCTGTLTLSGGSYLNPGDLFIIGENQNSHGTVTVNNAASQLTDGSELWIGQAGGNGTMNVSAGTVTVNNWVAIGRMGATGVLNLSGTGQFIKTGNNHLILGSDATGGSGTINQTGGSLQTSNATEVRIGANAGSTGLWDISAGTGTLGNNLVVGDGGTGTFNLHGTGAVTAPTVIVARASNGTVNMSGGSLAVANTVTVQGSANTGTFNLSGGKLSVDGSIDIGSGNFNFTGGTVTRSSTGVITFNGNLTIGSHTGVPTIELDADKTFNVNGVFDITTGVGFNLTGDTIPAPNGTSIVTGSFGLGTDLSIIGTFAPSTSGVFGLSNLASATFISETAGESAGFNAATQSVYWLQESNGAVSLQYSIAPTPEPTSLGLLGMSGLILTSLRRRRS